MNSTPRAIRSAAGARAAALLDRLWRASPPLTAVGALMLVVAGTSLVGLLVDPPRIITGAPACCSGGRCGDRASWRAMRRRSHRS
jgi:hypothetical protein